MIYTIILFMPRYPYSMIILFSGNYLFPRILNAFYFFHKIKSCHNPCICTVTWHCNNDILSFCTCSKPLQDTTFYMSAISFRGVLMIFTWNLYRTRICFQNLTPQRMSILLVSTFHSCTLTMYFLFFACHISVHLDNDHINLGNNTFHDLIQILSCSFAPVPYTFPSISVLTQHILFRLNSQIIIFFSGYLINHAFQHKIICRSFTYNTYPLFHNSSGTPPRSPLIQSLDKDCPVSKSSWEI